MTERFKHPNILNGDIKTALIKMAIPLMVFNLINVVYSLVDTYWVGRIGELQAGAISLVFPITACGTAFVTGLSAGGMALMSKAIGAKKYERTNHIATILIEMAIIFGLSIGICIFLFVKPIVIWLKTPTDIFKDCFLYLRGLSFDFLFAFIITIFQAIRQSAGDSKTGVIINIVSAILNTILDPILIFGLNLGVLGAAVATVLSKVIVTPIVFFILFKKNDLIYIDFKKYRFDYKLTFEVVKVGLPASIGAFLADFGFVLMNKDIVSYGSIVMSAYGIGNKISNIVYVPTNALAVALTPFIGQNIGAHNYERTKDCYKQCMLLTLFLSVVLLVLGFIITKPATLFLVKNASNELISLSCEYCYYSIGTIFFMGWMNNLIAAFNGAGYTRITLIINTLRLWGLRIPMIKFFKNYTNLGPTGIWWSMILSNILICIIGQIIYHKVFLKRLNENKL